MGRAFEYRRASKEKRWDKMSKLFPKLSIPNNPIPGLVWSRQNSLPSFIPPVFARLILIFGKFFEIFFILFNCVELFGFLLSSTIC